MTKNQAAARQQAFEAGQQAAREERHNNPYPPISPDHEMYDQGYQKEMGTIFD